MDINPLSRPEQKDLATLPSLLKGLVKRQNIGEKLRMLISEGWGNLPFPGSGDTLTRWRVLAQVAKVDLSLAKLLESHADALAILHELNHPTPQSPQQIWSVWCAEPPNKRVRFSRTETGSALSLQGTKAWCSGAHHTDYALVSGWNEDGKPCLAAVNMNQREIEITADGWSAVGMQATASMDVVFNDATAQWVGQADSYVHRPGFQHGAGSVASCWYGAAVSIVETVHSALKHKSDDAHALAHLGVMDVALAQAASQLRNAAQAIDANPHLPCQHAISRARLAVESAAETILIRAPRAVGAGPLCKDAHFARMMADLPVFIRQSHAERDLAAHGKHTANMETRSLWTL